MNHKGTQIIKTKRLVLRRFTLDDVEAMFNNWASEPEVSKYLTWNAHETIETTKEVIDMWLSRYPNDNNYEWCVEYDGIPIGGIAGVEVNEQLKAVAIGYCYGTKWWGNGIATEALQAVIDYWFDIGFNRIWGVHHVDNPASGRVMEKCGLKYEGIIRQGGVTLDDNIHDVKQYAIIANDRNLNKEQAND